MKFNLSLTRQTAVAWLRARRFSLIIGGSLFVVALFLGFAVLLFGVYVRQWDGPVTRVVAGALRLPAARVGNSSVRYTDYLVHLDAQRRFLSGPAARALGLPDTLNSTEKTKALDRAIRIVAVDQLAAEKKFTLTPLDVEREYSQLVERAGTSTTPEEIRQYLQDNFGWDEQNFKQYLMRPALTEDALRQMATNAGGDVKTFEKDLQTRLDGAKRLLRL